MTGSRVDLYAAIRRDARASASNRALQRKYGVGYRTVVAALSSVWPEPRKPLERRSTGLDRYHPVIDQWLRADLDAPRKQRHTAQRIFDRLQSECQADGVSYWMVRTYVARRRQEIKVESGKLPADAFVIQNHAPGQDAEVDFGEVMVKIRGEQVLCAMFCLRLSYSGRAVHRISLSAGQEAFFEGHAHAFEILGGVPRGKIRFDNLKAAVASIIGFTRARIETERWVAFRSHYGVDAFYCEPGIGGAHEKGGVEGEIGRFRRNRLVPVPEVDSIAELNEMIDAWDVEDEQRRIGSRLRTVGEHFAMEKPLLAPLPEDAFETGRWFTPRVDRYSQIAVRTGKYSVPVRYVGRQVRVLLHASELVVYDGRTVIARHERLIAKGGTRLVLDHYLEILLRKPGAFPGSTALEQARTGGRFTPVHDAWWAQACKIHGDTAGTRALIEVLLLHRHMSHEHVVAGLAAALKAGAFTVDAVALESRVSADHENAGKSADTGTSLAIKDHSVQPATALPSLTERRLRASQLPIDRRPLPTVDQYDQLLPSRRTATPGERSP